MSELNDIRDAFRRGRVRWRLHAQQRMFERHIWRDDVSSAIMNGEVIEAYGTNKPYPCYLIYGNANGRALHVLVAWETVEEIAYVITAYEPDEGHFEADLKTRKEKR